MKYEQGLLFLLVFITTCLYAAETYNPRFLSTNSIKSVVPIVEKTVSTANISSEELKAIFTMSVSRWSDGQKITLFILPETNKIQRRFLWEYFGLTPSHYTEIIESRVKSGKTQGPIIVSSENEMMRKVSTTRGSIGFIGSTIYVSDRDGIKTLKLTD